MNFATVLAVLVAVVAVPLNWYVTVKLWRLSRTRPALRVLRERAIVAFALALIATGFALVVLNNEQAPPPLNLDSTKIVSRTLILATSVIPALWWLRLYRNEP